MNNYNDYNDRGISRSRGGGRSHHSDYNDAYEADREKLDEIYDQEFNRIWADPQKSYEEKEEMERTLNNQYEDAQAQLEEKYSNDNYVENDYSNDQEM